MNVGTCSILFDSFQEEHDFAFIAFQLLKEQRWLLEIYYYLYLTQPLFIVAINQACILKFRSSDRFEQFITKCCLSISKYFRCFAEAKFNVGKLQRKKYYFTESLHRKNSIIKNIGKSFRHFYEFRLTSFYRK